MYRQRHDQFAKELLITILEPFGLVRRQVEVSPEPTYIDVVFEGLSPLLTPEEILTSAFWERSSPDLACWNRTAHPSGRNIWTMPWPRC